MPDKPVWEGRSRGSRFGYISFVWLLKKAGLNAAYSLLFFVALYYRYFVRHATEPLKDIYQNKLGFSRKETRKLISRNITVFGQTLIDKIAVLSGVPVNFSFEHDGINHIRQLVSEGKGGILLSGHLGNWEIAGHLLKMVDAVVNIVMYDGEDRQIKEYMGQFENKRSFNVILIREDLSHIYEISAALTRNELICLHGDRFRPGQRKMTHNFLGQEADFPAGPFILASKLKAPVCFVFAVKESDFHYHFYSEPPEVYQGRGAEGMEKMLDNYVAVLEKMLKRYPEQWFNYYNFWKK